MAAATRLNKEVTLTGSSNNRLAYPVAGVIEDAEIAVDGSMLWGAFRIRRPDGSLSCPVVVRNIATA